MKYKYQPKTKDKLMEIIDKEIKKQGNNADLDMIDTSLITDMSGLFEDLEFDGDISQWNVSNVKNMNNMFNGTSFNGDISKWNVSNVKNMGCMFKNSNFDGDISQWNVSNVTDMLSMFSHSKFNGDISKWDVSDVGDAAEMMNNSKIPDKVKATIMLKLSKNNECVMYEIIEGFVGKRKDKVVEFILDNFDYEDICYAFKKADIPYEEISYLVNKLLKTECLFDIYPELHGELLDDILNI